jgi:Tfp pilus assembly PilM family ATPase
MQGIGIMYGTEGARVLSILKTDKGLEVTGIGAGIPWGSLDSFASVFGVRFENSTIALGLGPGDFLSASFSREKGMDIPDIKEHLKWEIERKMLSDVSTYNIDYAVTDSRGFVFACRKKLIEEKIKPTWKVVTDVEPIALLNGCEASGEIQNEAVMLISVEPEGISSVVINNKMPVVFDSFPVKEKGIVSLLPNPDTMSSDKEEIDSTETDRVAGYIIESINRLTSLGENKDTITPKRFVLAGSGAYVGDLTGVIETKTGIKTILSNPFDSIVNDISDINPQLASLSAAFTTCFGLALRAMEA